MISDLGPIVLAIAAIPFFGWLHRKECEARLRLHEELQENRRLTGQSQ